MTQKKQRTNEPRCMVRVPESFRDKLNAKANELGIDATVMMENSEVVYNGRK